MGYAIIADDHTPIIKPVEPIHNVPWAPHVGIRITIKATPKEVMLPVIIKEKTLPKEDEEGDEAEEDHRLARRLPCYQPMNLDQEVVQSLTKSILAST